MEITRCVFASARSDLVAHARKIRIAYNITVCTRRVGPLANTITVRRTGHITVQYMLITNSLYRVTSI